MGSVKIAQGTLVHQKNDTHLCGNYGPISLKPVFSKSIKKIKTMSHF